MYSVLQLADDSLLTKVGYQLFWRCPLVRSEGNYSETGFVNLLSGADPGGMGRTPPFSSPQIFKKVKNIKQEKEVKQNKHYTLMATDNN